jgi:excinuclease UvrABC ATPase subunit
VVTTDSAPAIARAAEAWPAERVTILAAVTLSPRLGWEEQAQHLQKAGYTRIWLGGEAVPLDPLPRLPARTKRVQLVVDRFTWSLEEPSACRFAEQAFRRGRPARAGRETAPRGRASAGNARRATHPPWRPERSSPSMVRQVSAVSRF